MTPSKRRENWPEAATPSNFITILRILLVPVFVAILLAPWPEWFGLDVEFTNNWKSILAAIVFVIISGTDWLDGYLARSRNEVTDFGKFMDPLADKILVVAALVSLVELGDLPTWVVLIILAREFIVSGVRMMAASKGIVISASMIGKFKTVFQMIAIVLFVIKRSFLIESLGDSAVFYLYILSWAIMLIALVLTIVSMVDYLVKARDVIGLGSTANKNSNIKGSDSGTLLSKEELFEIARTVVENGTANGFTVATAESLTGGMIGSTITSIPGSSAVYAGGIVSYTNEVKQSQLGVLKETLDGYGAVSEEVALQMASGVRERLSASVGVAVTGLAGPDGDDRGNPVGTVWIGVSTVEGSQANRFVFEGDRNSVRIQTVYQALKTVVEAMDKIEPQ